MTEWAGSDAEETIVRLGEANEALTAKVQVARRATADARVNERYYRALFDAIDDGFCVIEILWDAGGRPFDYRFVEVNAAFETHTGLADAEGRSIREMRPGHEQHWFDLYGEVARTGEPAHSTQHAEELGDRWFRVSAFALGGDPPSQVGVVFRDISRERAEQERRLATSGRHSFLLRLGDAVRSLTDPDAIRARSAELLREHLDLSRCGYGEVDADEVVTVGADDRDSDLPAIGGTRTMAGYDRAIMDLFRSGRTIVVHDAAEDSRTQAPEIAALRDAGQIGAAVEVPLMRGERLSAILFAHQREARRWTDDEVALVEDVAERTWAMVERARGTRALRSSEERQSFLLALSDTLRPLDDPADIAAQTAATVERHLGVARCVYGELDDSGERFTLDRDWPGGRAEESGGGVDLRAFGDLGSPLRDGETVVVEDTAADARTNGAAAAFKSIGGVRAVIGVPLSKGGAVCASFAVHHTAPRRWTAEEVALVEEVADRTWASMERAHARRALADTRARAELALGAVGMGSWVWYPIEDRAESDARLTELCGFDPSKTLNLARELAEVIQPEDRDRYDSAVSRACDPRGDGRLHEEVRIVRPDKRKRVLSILGRTDFDVKGTAVRMHGVAIDLTDQRRAERRARDERLDRERRDREFVSNAAHELRTPLTGIIAAMDALEAGAADEPRERERFLGHIRGAAERMSRLSESLLLLAQPFKELPVEPVDVSAVLCEVAAGLQPDEDVRVTVEVPGALTVATNPGLLERVVVNLAENAVAHTRDGQIELRCIEAPGGVSLTVSNTGERIDPEVAERAFDRFYRGTEGNGGFGLGLAIAAQAARAIGARLTLEPGAQCGTVARLVLPRDGEVSPP